MAYEWKLAFVDACYACVEDEAGALSNALRLLKVRLGAAMGNLLVLDSGGRLIEQLCAVDVPPGMMEDYEKNFLNLDPWPSIPEFARLRAGTATTTTDWDLKSSLVPTHFYQDFWRRWGLHHTSGAYVGLADGAILSPSLPRFHQDGGFSPGADADLRFAVKHLARAVGVLRTVRGLRSTVARHEGVAQQLHCALIHLDATQRVLFANQAGMALLSGSSVLQMRFGRAHVVARDTNERFQLAVRGLTSEPPTSLLPAAIITTDHAGTRWIIHFAPVGEPGRRAAALMVANADSPAPVGVEALALMGGLSNAEREILSLLMDGLASSEIAARRRTGVETVRGQIKSLMKKLGVRSSAQLAELAARSARPFR